MTRRSSKSSCLLALAVAAGVVDAVSYLGLGRVFTANMTGNTVLLGVAVARGSGADAARAATALGGFCSGGAAGVAMIRSASGWPRRATATFALETVALIALLTLWATLGSSSIRYWLIVVSGIAMGAQSAAVRASDVRGVNTTYMTSTLLNALAGAVGRLKGRREVEEGARLPGVTWATYAAGALGGALAERSWGYGAVAISLAIVGTVTLLATRSDAELLERKREAADQEHA